jgi:NAD(P)H dehydrogenase (quinone)
MRRLPEEYQTTTLIYSDMKHIVIINGHPDKESYNFALHRAYMDNALKKGHRVDEVILTDLQFNPILQYGYRQRTELEPDLLEAWDKIRAAEHIVWIYPVWWGMMPALLKGFIDRLFLPGFTFQYRENSQLWDKLLIGKTSELICTLDYPVWYYKWVLGESGVKAMRKMILDFCGIKNIRTTYIGPVKGSTPEFREKKIQLIAHLV